jgi:hypothetical protein
MGQSVSTHRPGISRAPFFVAVNKNDRARQADRWRDRSTDVDRVRDGGVRGQTERQIGQTDREIQIERQNDRQIDRKTDRLTDRQKYRQKDREKGRQTGRKT